MHRTSFMKLGLLISVFILGGCKEKARDGVAYLSGK